jgi:hypothetical protein
MSTQEQKGNNENQDQLPIRYCNLCKIQLHETGVLVAEDKQICYYCKSCYKTTFVK